MDSTSHVSSAQQAATKHELPRIAAVIPTLNESAALKQTLASLLAQDYPNDRYEILVIDGGSSDGTQDIAMSFQDHGVRLRLLANPGRTTPAAVNLAIKSTDADAILWLSGHCLLSSGYLSQTSKAFADAPKRVTGGRLDVRGEGVRGTLNALLLSSRFGTGVSPLRFGHDPGPTSTVTFALFDRQTLIDVGGLDESLARNQDNDLVARLTENGIQFWRVDALATYLAPKTLSGLWRRAFLNGAWSVWGLRRGRGGHSWWHFVPMAMVGSGVLLLAMSLFGLKLAPWSLTVLALCYGLLAAGSAIGVAAPRSQYWAIPLLPFLFFIHHVIYGLGSWSALLRPNPVPPRSSQR
jgi:glycosyltransferase involved in cell wall biosynthesis